MNKLTLLILIPLSASCATPDQITQRKATILASAESFCANLDHASKDYLRCVGLNVYHADDSWVARNPDGSLQMVDIPGSEPTPGPTMTSSPNAY